MIRTAESVTLTCCPPAPLDRYVSIRRSLSAISIAMSSSTSGATKTEAKEVCRRCAASNGEMRTRRWTPISRLRYPYAWSPTTWSVALFRPASSPSCRSISSAFQPRDSANRMYMRRSISAQSWDSVPPGARVDREPRVAGVFGSAHLDGQLELVGEARGGLERFPRLVLGGLPFPQQLPERLELLAELVEPLCGGQPPLEAARLTQRLLGRFRLGPEVGGCGLLPQIRERAPRGVQIKDSPGAPRGVPRRWSEGRGDRRVRS